MSASVLDIKILFALARGAGGNGSHAERMQRFYAPQAEHYDEFRERLLSGRRDLVDALKPHDGARVVELGGGTGFNLTYFGDRIARLGQATIVDLCPALLDRARARWQEQDNVRIVEADATTYRPDAPVDCVYFSYALTMMPDARAAIDNARAMLKPGGILGVVDFYVSAARPEGGIRHNAFTRAFWPRWFAHDGVRLGPDTLSYLCRVLPDHTVSERRASVPYVPALRVPYFLFVGRV